MLPSGVTIVRAEGDPPAEEMAEVHRATASVAYAHIFTTPFPLDDARAKWASRTGDVWLARRGPDLVGFASATGTELDGLYVLPAEAGSGIGTALLAALPTADRLWVLEDNRAGRRFYEQRGWHNNGSRREAYGVWDVLYVR